MLNWLSISRVLDMKITPADYGIGIDGAPCLIGSIKDALNAPTTPAELAGVPTGYIVDWTREFVTERIKDAESWYDYAIMVLRKPYKDSVIVWVKRTNVPCFGELRPYKRGEYRPDDLHWPFPSGIPLALAIRIAPNHSASTIKLPIQWMIQSPASPWFELNKYLTIEYDEDRAPIALAVTDTRVNPDVLLNLIIGLRSSFNTKYWDKNIKSLDGNLDHQLALFTLCWMTGSVWNKDDYFFNLYQSYLHQGGTINLKTWANKTPTYAGKGTFVERTGYNRELIEHIWQDGQSEIPKEKFLIYKDSKNRRVDMEAMFDSILAEILKIRSNG
jgi:hypothetical protein